MMTVQSPLDSALAQWVGPVGGLTDREYRNRLLSAVRESSAALEEEALSPEDRMQVLTDHAELAREWLHVMDSTHDYWMRRIGA